MQVRVNVSPTDIIVLEHMATEQGTTKEEVAAAIISPTNTGSYPGMNQPRTIQQAVRERLGQITWDLLNAGEYPVEVLNASAAKAEKVKAEKVKAEKSQTAQVTA